MQRYAKTLGGLNCQIVDNLVDGQIPELVVILCHGFGAPGSDLVSIGPELIGQSSCLEGKTRFIFPAAPLSLDNLGMYGCRAWWMIDMARLSAAIEGGEFRDMRDDLPDGLLEARALLMALIAEVQAETGIPFAQIALGGFSQGSVLATDVTLRLPGTPAALCIWSGALMCQAEWEKLAACRKGLSVLQSHGHEDPLLSFQGATELRDLLTRSGIDVEFIAFHGAHQIPQQAIQGFARILDSKAVLG